MRFTMKRITPFLLYSADSREDLLCKRDHKPAEQAQEALGTLAGVMALDRHTDLDDAPAEDNNADGLDRGEDEVREIARLQAVGHFTCARDPVGWRLNVYPLSLRGKSLKIRIHGSAGHDGVICKGRDRKCCAEDKHSAEQHSDASAPFVLG